MNEQLNEEFEHWIGRFGIDWAIPTNDVPKYLAREEIENRITFYPAFRHALQQQPITMVEVQRIGPKCWSLSQQYDLIRFGEFMAHPESVDAITKMVADFPRDDSEASRRIDDFIEKCRFLGYTKPNTKNFDGASAAVLASVILSAAFPHRFVDYRQGRWSYLANELDSPLFAEEKPSHGVMIVEASRFATEICDTASFKKFFPKGEPLWTIAGICWTASTGHGAEGPKSVEPYYYEEDFDEGAIALRLHRIRERNREVVKKAKAIWRASDPLLRCDVCQFSFVEAYGAHGEGYIEAHHTKPLSSLIAGERTKVSDLAKVCANCHRMLHVDFDCLELEELREKVRNTGDNCKQ